MTSLKQKLRKSSKMLPKCEKWENHTFQKHTVHVLWEQAVNLFEIKTSLFEFEPFSLMPCKHPIHF